MREWFEQIHRVLHDHIQPTGFRTLLRLTGILACENEKRIDEMSHLLGGALADLEPLPILLGAPCAFEGGLGLGKNHEGRGPELVGRVRGEAGLSISGGLQTIERLVQHIRKLSKFTLRISDINAFREIAVGDRLGGCADGVDGLDAAGGQQPADRQSEQQDTSTRANEARGELS